MTPNWLYYRIKPIMPAPLRLGIRGWLTRRRRKSVGAIWPILPGSERPPANWPGWPEGKEFAFVLTHDVEGAAGLAKCRQLMEVEKKWGFRSSFNFIPEGEYRVPWDLREELAREGFEVGVHDLEHDGSLYNSQGKFAGKAARINAHLQEWGAAGFRSGFMMHNLDWLHHLKIGYDASTFDTDPFEPQPDGAGTIFPFWKQDRQGGGYVELPYSLPQDSTLFLLLRERTTEIWRAKLDWIAKHGGMALLDTHPDYMAFAGEEPCFRSYPVARYEEFLQYAREQFGGKMWHVLPREMAEFVAPLRLEPPRKPKRICMVTYSYYLADARVTRYAEALAERGDEVDVISLERWEKEKEQAPESKVNVVRLQSRFKKEETSPLSYLLPVLRFFWTSFWWIGREHTRKRYDFLHIHNVPDFLVFTAAYPRLTGAKVILDIHDIVPEFYASKFSGKENSLMQFGLKLVEKLSARFSHHVIMSNHLWLEKYTARTGMEGRCTVFINNVDTRTFRPRARTRQDDKFIVIFPGGLQWHQGLDIAIRAFARVSQEAPRAEFHIYGDGSVKKSLMDLAQELGLNGKVRFFDPVPVRAIAEVMANADLGVVPKRADSFGNEAYSTKIMEFMSLGIPVVVSSTKIDRFYFNDSVVCFFESGNVPALADALLKMIRDQNLREGMARRALEYATQNSWESRKVDYLDLVDSVCAGARGGLNPTSQPQLAKA